MNKTKGFLSLLSAGLIFATFGIWIRLLNRELTTYQQILFRQVVGLILAVIIIFLLKQKWRLNGVKKTILIGYGLAFPISVIFFVLAMLSAKISVVTFSFYATSLFWSFVLGFFLFKDKLSKTKTIAMFLIIVGIGFYFFPLSNIYLSMGLIFGLVGGVFDALANAFRKYLSGKIDRFVLIALQMVGGIMVISVLMFFSKETFFPSMSSLTIVIGLIFGLLLMIVNFLLLHGFQNVDLNLGTIILTSELIFATIFGVLIYREYPTINEIVGSLFIFLGIIIPNLPAKIYGRAWKKS